MNIYYKRIKEFDKWPNNDVVLEDWVHFSTAKKTFDKHTFLVLSPHVDKNERIKRISEEIKQPIKKLHLIKLTR